MNKKRKKNRNYKDFEYISTHFLDNFSIRVSKSHITQ